MKLHLCPGGKVKERLLGWLFKGTSEQEFQVLCQHFAADNRHLLRPAGIETIKDAIANGIRVVVVSASIETWVRPFFSQYPEVTVVGTRMQVADGQLTGRFEGPNCYGQEKVNRLEALLGNRADYHLKAFGDSRGDKELFAFADEHIYKPFRNKEQEELCQE